MLNDEDFDQRRNFPFIFGIRICVVIASVSYGVFFVRWRVCNLNIFFVLLWFGFTLVSEHFSTGEMEDPYLSFLSWVPVFKTVTTT